MEGIFIRKVRKTKKVVTLPTTSRVISITIDAFERGN